MRIITLPVSGVKAPSPKGSRKNIAQTTVFVKQLLFDIRPVMSRIILTSPRSNLNAIKTMKHPISSIVLTKSYYQQENIPKL